MADRRPTSSSNDRLRLPSSNAGERDETSSSSTVRPSNPESRTRTPAVSMPMSAPTQAYVPQPHPGSLINTTRNPAPTGAPNSSQQQAAKLAFLTAEISALRTRIAAHEKEDAKLKAKNEKLKTENKRLETENEELNTENELYETENDKLKEENRVLKALNDTLIEMGTKLEKLSLRSYQELLDCSGLVRAREGQLLASLSLAHEVLAGCFAGGYVMPNGLPGHLVSSYKKALELSKSIPTMLGLTESDAGPADSPTNMADSDASSDSDYSYRSQSDIDIDSEGDGGGDSDGDSDGESGSGNDGMGETLAERISKLPESASDELVAKLLNCDHD
ncbi:uncharacterized protein LTHEOB_2930 [Lasiodiplodia theobromae]|uniref:uncharacterized protein n=1 Tax=Lasiodiplodia theobromae TaxID=45133 RepID=UPI0015C3F6E6|nr:uncharacterized protein LTHEOB_2930 [Lasiodiplodia theobromae]KAF4534955.1 hypothetical protein LTHEOB_2930 [Lasiodiplodia theobromae]